MKATTATHLDDADMLAVLKAMVRDDQSDNTERVPYTGPEPIEERLTDRDADIRAGVEEDRHWRSLP